MDWLAVAKLVAPFAPTAGRFLGGLVPFPGAAIIGGLVGDAIASALGVSATPDAVADAITNMPPDEVQARLQAVETEAKAKYDAMARIAEAEAADRSAQSKVINETIREEAAQGVSWWHWRHQLGNVVILWFLMPLPAFAVLTFRYNAEALTQLTALINACIPLYGFMSGLLGYVAQDSTKLKTAAITGEQPPSITDSVVKTVKQVATKVPTRPTKIVPLNTRD